MRSKLIWSLIAGVVGFGALIGFLLSPLYVQLRVDISEYGGDGQISRIGYFLGYGYQVDLDEFTLETEHAKEYRLTGYPDIQKSLSFGLNTDAGPEIVNAADDSVLSMKVESIEGIEIFNINAPLSEWIVGGSPHTRWRIYYLDWIRETDVELSTSIDYDRARFGEDLILTVSYRPGTTGLDVPVVLTLECGGYW